MRVPACGVFFDDGARRERAGRSKDSGDHRNDCPEHDRGARDAPHSPGSDDNRSPPHTVPPTTTTAPPPPTTTEPPPPPTTTSTAGSFVDSLVGVDGARQVIAVIADGYRDTTATLTAYQDGPGGWRQVFSPSLAYIGEAGFAPPGEKVEGDLRTPSGSYGFDFFFGVDSEPSGITFPWRSITPSDVWNDDPLEPLLQPVDRRGDPTRRCRLEP